MLIREWRGEGGREVKEGRRNEEAKAETRKWREKGRWKMRETRNERKTKKKRAKGILVREDWAKRKRRKVEV